MTATGIVMSNDEIIERYPAVIAHRGAGKDAPENTLAAFRLGASYGFTMFECDAKLSQDHILFLLHDSTLERTTNGVGDAKKEPWNALSQLDAGSWHSPEYTGETVPRLGALVDYIVANQYRLNIEIKPNPGEAYETGKAVATLLQDLILSRLDSCLDLLFDEPLEELFDRLYDDLVENPTTSCVKRQFLLSSFEPVALKGAKEIAPTLPRALLLDEDQTDIEKVIAQLQALECQGVVAYYPLVSEEFMQRCREIDCFVMVYTVNDPNEAKRLLELGVTSVITDNMSFADLF